MASTAAVAPVPRAKRGSFSVAIPDGLSPGSVFTVRTAEGGLQSFVVPDGASSGTLEAEAHTLMGLADSVEKQKAGEMTKKDVFLRERQIDQDEAYCRNELQQRLHITPETMIKHMTIFVCGWAVSLSMIALVFTEYLWYYASLAAAGGAAPQGGTPRRPGTTLCLTPPLVDASAHPNRS